MTESPLVSVLVLNYNGRKFLEDCFSSLMASTYPAVEIIMIDNKSTDDSVAYIESKFPEVRVFQNGINAGFSLAYNNAFELAKGKYYVLLNNDVRVDPGWLEPLVEVAESDEDIGALQPKLLSMLDPGMFEYAGASGGQLDMYGYPFARGRVFSHLEADSGQYDDEVRIFWATGAAMFVRAEVLEITGGLDVDFVHHMEEIDLCYRINLAGYEIRVVPRSVIYHYGGGIIAYDSYKKMYWNHRNSLMMLLKNLEGRSIPRIVGMRMLLDFLTLGWCILHRDFRRPRAIVHAYLWLLTHPFKVARKRRVIAAMRKLTDREVFRLMHPKSVVVQSFILKKNTYNDLIGNKKVQVEG